MTGGEPLTPSKAAEIRLAGATAVNMYASSEVGTIGYGCAGATRVCDDIHILEGSQAVIQYERTTPFGGGSVQSLLFTSLHERAAKILVNVESGDYGVLDTRECGCMFGELGLKRHLHTIRSFDKLTGQGMTFVGTDIVRIIEEVLPARFGGVSTDYQMVELEDVGGQTRLDVIVGLNVGVVDEAQVVDLVLDELSKGSDTNRMMAAVWRERQVLRVRRENPHLTSGGKLLSLHIGKKG
jgi:phenylacetate-coenzyme A ligase PaaK-like adenylate-forming protein